MAPLADEWSGFVRLSLISIPIRAIPAVSGKEEIRLAQIHAHCHSPLQVRQICPIHGLVTSDDIVYAYEFAKGQFVVIETNLLTRRSGSEGIIRIDTFVSPKTVDPLNFCDLSYFIIPNGPVALKAYAVLREGMKESDCFAVAQATLGTTTLGSREFLVLLRPIDDIFVMTRLVYQDRMLLKPVCPQSEFSPGELKLAKTLIKLTTANKFNLSSYKDPYTESLSRAIEAKVLLDDIVEPARQLSREADEGNLPRDDSHNSSRDSVAPAKSPIFSEFSKASLAMALLIQHPDWTNARIADAIGCNVKYLSQLPNFKAAKKLVRESGKRNLPRGSKGKKGDVEAWDEREDDSAI